jgi:cobalt-zinc-cadmium efflux system membrane fusion protein
MVDPRIRHLLGPAAVVLVLGCNGAPAEVPAAAAPPPKVPESFVRTVTPEYRLRSATLATTGRVQFDEETLVRVHAPLTGRVLEALARPGDAVEAGARLLVLESPDLAAAKSDYAKALAEGERAEAALALARDLLEVKAIAAKEVRAAEIEHQKAVAERARARLRLAMLGLTESQLHEIAAGSDLTGSIVIRAPRSGIVVERNAMPGQVVAYGQSDTPATLFVIADLDAMWVVADVYEPDVASVRPGQAIAVSRPCCPAERLPGRISYVADAVDSQTRTVKVRATVPNPGRMLKAEMFVKVSIETGATRALVVPQSAVHREGSRTFVLVETGKDRYQRRPVAVGGDADGVVEILEGVRAGERVVASGSILLLKTTP